MFLLVFGSAFHVGRIQYSRIDSILGVIQLLVNMSDRDITSAGAIPTLATERRDYHHQQ